MSDQTPEPAPEQPRSPLRDPALVAVVREIEEHSAGRGWDQPAALYALVRTVDLVAQEPALAAAMGLEAGPADESLTPVEQEELPAGVSLEQTLAEIVWPEQVLGCAAVVERLVLPPAADADLPQDGDAAWEYAAEHPDRQEVRIVAAVLRGGATFCALRMRTHDEPFAVVESPDLVPALLGLLSGTLEQ